MRLFIPPVGGKRNGLQPRDGKPSMQLHDRRDQSDQSLSFALGPMRLDQKRLRGGVIVFPFRRGELAAAQAGKEQEREKRAPLIRLGRERGPQPRQLIGAEDAPARFFMKPGSARELGRVASLP